MTTNGVTLINYTTKVFAQQPWSTGITNINPFAVFSWQGKLSIIPQVDNFEDTVKLSTITSDTSTTVKIPRQWGYQPQPGDKVQFAPAPSGWTLHNFLVMAVGVHHGDTNVAGDIISNNPADWWWIP